MASGGPWGTGGNGGGNRPDGDGRRGEDKPADRRPRRPGDGPQMPEIDQIIGRGREQLRVLMGGRGGAPPPRGEGPRVSRGGVAVAGLAAAGLWAFMSFYTVQPSEQSVELFLGSYAATGGPGLNFAPWPFVTYEVIATTTERTESIGASDAQGAQAGNAGLMLTTDANIVDVGFQVVWNVNDPAALVFNLREEDEGATVRAVSESVMREIVAASTLAPILNRDRGLIAQQARERIQATLDEYQSGINVVRVNLERAAPPTEVIDAYRDVQAAEQERDLLQRQADAYANRRLAESRGEAAQVVEQAEAYRAQTVNDALGQASRFTSVLAEYQNAEGVTRQRIYIETMERVMRDVGKVILDPALTGVGGGQGVVPFLPLDQLVRPAGGIERPPATPEPPAGGAPAAATTVTGN